MRNYCAGGYFGVITSGRFIIYQASVDLDTPNDPNASKVMFANIQLSCDKIWQFTVKINIFHSFYLVLFKTY